MTLPWSSAPNFLFDAEEYLGLVSSIEYEEVRGGVPLIEGKSYE